MAEGRVKVTDTAELVEPTFAVPKFTVAGEAVIGPLGAAVTVSVLVPVALL
jgi:hypothetical protein